LESELGRGSAFWFDVSLQVLTATFQERVVRAIVGYEGTRRKVLVADDRTDNREMLADLLAPLGFDVSTVDDGQEAIDKALAWQPDALVLDLMMPVKSGFEVAQEIRQRSEIEAKRMYIIAASASVLEIDQEKSRAAGCDAFLPKPIKADRLLDFLATPLGLTWVYAKADVVDETPLVPPPPEEMSALYRLAEEGRVFDLQAAAERLGMLNEAYVPFARRLKKLAKAFEIDQIKVLIEQYKRL
jgi:CheY-like chemotaxis protein